VMMLATLAFTGYSFAKITLAALINRPSQRISPWRRRIKQD